MRHLIVLIVTLVSSWSVAVNAAPPTGRYKIIVERLQALQAAYPTVSSIFSIGQNDDGTDIFAMRVSVTPTVVDPAKVAHVVVGTHHGNESHAPLFTAVFLEDLLQKYMSDEIYRGNLGQTEWVVIPVLNITGYNNNSRNERGYDSNRDYPGPCISSPGGKVKSIRTLMAFLNSRIFTGSVTVHGYVGSLTYPWGIDVHDTHSLDHNAFESITSKAAELNGYVYGTSTDIVYPADGTYEDYAYWKHGLWTLLLELRDGSENDLRKTSQAIHYFFDQIDSSASTKNQLTSACQRRNLPDLHLE